MPALQIIKPLSLLLLLFVSLASSVFAESSEEMIPQKDWQSIERLFSYLVCESDFGYTIYGSKPVSLTGYFLETPFGNLIHPKSTNIKAYWKIWAKYQYLFPMTDYLLLDDPDENPNLRIITLINIPSFIRIVNENLSLFQSKLGNNISAEYLLKQLCSQSSPGLFAALNKDEVLYGIVLGYGVSSPSFYQHRFELMAYLSPLLNQQFTLNYLRPLQPFESISEELLALKSQTRPPPQRHFLCPIEPVVFISASGDSEAEALFQKYKNDQRRLCQIYQGNHFAETSLSKLCSKL